MDYSKYNIKKIKNNVFYNNKGLEIIQFEKKEKDELIKRQDLIKIVEYVRNDLQKRNKDGLLAVSIQYPNRWYSSDAFKLFDDEMKIFSMDQYDEFGEDPNEYIKFRLHFIPIDVKPKSGGCKKDDKNNDCFFNAIRKFVHRPEIINDENIEDIKETLGLKRNDKIHIKHIGKIEELINNLFTNGHSNKSTVYSINVTGDHIYTSTLNTNKKIHIILQNGHYKADKTKMINTYKYTSHEDKIPLLYDIEKYMITTYDGETKKEITYEELQDIKNSPKTSEYVLVNKNFVYESKKLSMEEAYELYIKMADKFIEKKDKIGMNINFYRCGDIKHMALNLFYKINQSIIYETEPITKNEVQFLENATTGAITYCEPYEGEAYEYDINSLYPYLLMRNNYYYAFKEGKFMKKKQSFIDELFKYYCENKRIYYGVYRCIITNEIDTRNKKKDTDYYKDVRKFFVFNKSNYYTHIDIEMAFNLNLKITLIEDDQPNFLSYIYLGVNNKQNTIISGATIFKRYVEKLYELKNKKYTGAKTLLNILWGALCEKNNTVKTVESDEELNIMNCDITKISSNDFNIKSKFIQYENNYYKTNFARIKPFLLAYGRKFMIEKLNDFNTDDIIRIHTDGFYIKEPINLSETDFYEDKDGELHIEVNDERTKQKQTQIGQLRLVNHMNVKITGLNKIKKF